MLYNSPLVSVLIPAYNHEKYVQETIKSIINQTYQNIELIVVDDGSKDLTWAKIQELKEECEKRFVKVHFETKENEGTCKTLNRLLENAQGDFVYIIASDDLAKPQAIEKEVEFLLKNPDYSLCVGDNELIDSESRVCYWDKKRNIIYTKNKANFKTFGEFLSKVVAKFPLTSKNFGRYDIFYLKNYVPNGYLIRKSIFDTIGYFMPEAPLEDWWLMLQISKYAKMKYLNEILFSYRWHSTNAIKNTEKMLELANRTKDYEYKILADIDETKVLPLVVQTKKYGARYKAIGIPYFFMYEKWLKQNHKVRILKIFNKTVLKWEKELGREI